MRKPDPKVYSYCSISHDVTSHIQRFHLW